MNKQTDNVKDFDEPIFARQEDIDSLIDKGLITMIGTDSKGRPIYINTELGDAVADELDRQDNSMSLSLGPDDDEELEDDWDEEEDDDSDSESDDDDEFDSDLFDDGDDDLDEEEDDYLDDDDDEEDNIEYYDETDEEEDENN